LTIGNLEIPLAGREDRYSRRNPRTGFTMFNCPDELAPALKQAGFDVLTTANNHCMDRGEAGLLRTLQVLDRNGLAHTGTFAADPKASNYLIMESMGWRIGILAYSKSTNKLPLPKGKKWMCNLIDPNDDSEILASFERMKKKVDLTIVCLHFGKEYRNSPPEPQQRLVRKLLDRGAHLILGSHPHVLQKVVRTERGQTAIYSLGNFVSTCLQHIPRTKLGVILRLTAKRTEQGVVMTNVRCVPTWIKLVRTSGGSKFRVLPLVKALRNGDKLSESARTVMSAMRIRAAAVLRSPIE